MANAFTKSKRILMRKHANATILNRRIARVDAADLNKSIEHRAIQAAIYAFKRNGGRVTKLPMVQP